VAEHWTDAHILRGRQEIAAKHDREALADFQAALGPPSNLPVGLGYAEGANGAARGAEISYWNGIAYEDLGDKAKAAEAWNQAASRGGAGGAQSYYLALCLQKLGQNDRAKTLFQALVDSSQSPASGGGRGGRGAPQSPRARSANAHYLAGLGYLGLDNPAKAKAELVAAVQDSPDLLGARITLATLK
jgi:tetratricopeptide (TPR) repeat protein